MKFPDPNCSPDEAQRLARKYFDEWITDADEMYHYSRYMRWGIDMAVSIAIVYEDGQRQPVYRHGIPYCTEFREQIRQAQEAWEQSKVR
jgi:hypothetical protein